MRAFCDVGKSYPESVIALACLRTLRYPPLRMVNAVFHQVRVRRGLRFGCYRECWIAIVAQLFRARECLRGRRGGRVDFPVQSQCRPFCFTTQSRRVDAFPYVRELDLAHVLREPRYPKPSASSALQRQRSPLPLDFVSDRLH